MADKIIPFQPNGNKIKDDNLKVSALDEIRKLIGKDNLDCIVGFAIDKEGLFSGFVYNAGDTEALSMLGALEILKAGLVEDFYSSVD